VTSRGHRLAVRAASVLLGLTAGVAGAEIAARWWSGYGWHSQLRVLRTVEQKLPSRSAKWVRPDEASFYVERLPVAAGVERKWFSLEPALRQAPLEPALDRRYWAHAGFELPSEYEWNRRYVVNALCGESAAPLPIFSHVDDLFVFDPVDGQQHPAFRFLRSTHYPSGLLTNNFGWRGPDVALNKPAATIRIAFVGASTTIDPHGDRFSYPEYVGRWLQQWQRARAESLTFETINAGREGVASDSIAAIVATELVPVRPDLVVYYEGSNQFWPADFIPSALPPRPTQLSKRLPWIDEHSAIAVQLRGLWNKLHEGREPAKPSLTVAWPQSLDELDPPLDDPRLPVQLPVILRDLEKMRAALAAYGGTLMPSSFVWLVHDGLVLDRQRDAGLYSYLNESFWPFGYAHMRRLVDFENRVFRKYARAHALPFNDLASAYPADPRLFLDAIHMTPAGIKLKAWLVFQQLVPELERRIAAGTLPLADPGGRTAHPAFPRGAAPLVRLDDLRRSCAS
jgi:hypothetical protein